MRDGHFAVATCLLHVPEPDEEHEDDEQEPADHAAGGIRGGGRDSRGRSVE